MEISHKRRSERTLREPLSRTYSNGREAGKLKERIMVKPLNTRNVSDEVTEYEFSILARRLKRNKNFIVMTIGEMQTKETKVTVRIAGKGDLMDDGLLLEVDYDNNKAFFEEIKTKDHSIWITDSNNDISILARCWQDGCKGYSLCMFNKAMDFDKMLDSLITPTESLGKLEIFE